MEIGLVLEALGGLEFVELGGLGGSLAELYSSKVA